LGGVISAVFFSGHDAYIATASTWRPGVAESFGVSLKVILAIRRMKYK
jgi:hypothetical protein